MAKYFEQCYGGAGSHVIASEPRLDDAELIRLAQRLLERQTTRELIALKEELAVSGAHNESIRLAVSVLIAKFEAYHFAKNSFESATRVFEHDVAKAYRKFMCGGNSDGT